MTQEELLKIFSDTFGGDTKDVRMVFSPGRVNLIGEHIDYNGGHVFPAALTVGTYFAARKRPDRKVRFYSANFKDQGIVEWELPILSPNPAKGFSNYLAGMIWTYETYLHRPIPYGMDVCLWGNIPHSSGLSSSASVESGMGKILNLLFDFPVSNEEIAKAGQYAENQFNKVNCGIMDQFAIAMGKENHAIFLDTATLEYSYVPIMLGEYSLMIACTNKKRGLIDSKYNERRAECEEALRDLQKELPIKALCELTEEELKSNRKLISREVCFRRARHAVCEEMRTRDAVQLLQKGDILSFGKRMCESHDSLRDDYEVTGIELDTLVEASLTIDGVIGSRMTGAGFGGCAVSIIHKDAVEPYIAKVGEQYRKKIGYDASFYPVLIGDGTKEWRE